VGSGDYWNSGAWEKGVGGELVARLGMSEFDDASVISPLDGVLQFAGKAP
jgi:hypothetical protein